MASSEKIRESMLSNAQEITRLHGLIHETLKLRSQSPQKREIWANACAEFHSRYDRLAFPGGYKDAVQRLAQGDPDTVEAALCFLECRPYFFRSGYMFKKILKKVKHASLSPSQSERLEEVKEKLAEWKMRKKSAEQKL